MPEIIAQTIHHLGIVSGICDEIGLVEIINSIVPAKPNRNLTVGTRVKAMILNGLGFTGRPLYIAGQFFQHKALDLLFDEKITPEDLNDDALGRALDAIYEAGPEALFASVASNAVKVYKVKTNTVHLDTTSISVDGKYDTKEGIGLIKFGHSKDLRKDLKQLMLSLIVTNDGSIPLIGKVLPGNTSDATHFNEILQELKNNVIASEEDFIVLFDTAGFNEKTIVDLGGTTIWVSRVSDTINEAKELKKNAPEEAFVEILPGYLAYEAMSNYAGVPQRWIVIESEHALEREKKTIQRATNKEGEDLRKKTKKLCKQNFSCQEDAEKALHDLSHKMKYHKIESKEIFESKKYLKKGKPAQDTPFTKVFTIAVKIIPDNEKIDQVMRIKGKFIIATNELDHKKLDTKTVLIKYKEQSKVEGSFRFLKNPLCMAKSVYLKTESRIVALAVVMFLCLLVYAIAERALRIALVNSKKTVPNQLGKPIQNPTMRWVFQMFEDILVVRHKQNDLTVVQIINLSSDLIDIITLLGDKCKLKYILAAGTG